MRSFFSQLNIRQLIIHFMAAWLFIYATHTLTTLYDFSFLYKEFALQNRVMFKDRANNDMFIIQLGGYIGLIAAYIISWQLSEKKKWFWANSVIVMLLAFVLYYFKRTGWQSLFGIFLFPGRLFTDDNDFNTVTSIVIDGLFMLILGSLLFFSKGIIRFIDNGVNRVKAVPGSIKPMVNKAKVK